MKSTQNKIDMQALDTVTDQVLTHKPLHSSPMQMRPKPVDDKESTPGASMPKSTNKVTGEALNTTHRA